MTEWQTGTNSTNVGNVSTSQLKLIMIHIYSTIKIIFISCQGEKCPSYAFKVNPNHKTEAFSSTFGLFSSLVRGWRGLDCRLRGLRYVYVLVHLCETSGLPLPWQQGTVCGGVVLSVGGLSSKQDLQGLRHSRVGGQGEEMWDETIKHTSVSCSIVPCSCFSWRKYPEGLFDFWSTPSSKIRLFLQQSSMYKVYTHTHTHAHLQLLLPFTHSPQVSCLYFGPVISFHLPPDTSRALWLSCSGDETAAFKYTTCLSKECISPAAFWTRAWN